MPRTVIFFKVEFQAEMHELFDGKLEVFPSESGEVEYSTWAISVFSCIIQAHSKFECHFHCRASCNGYFLDSRFDNNILLLYTRESNFAAASPLFASVVDEHNRLGGVLGFCFGSAIHDSMVGARTPP
jgi:hypothetical protein